MKRILLAVPSLYGGGAERVVSVWAGQLAQKGYDVSLLLFGRLEKEYVLEEKVKVYSVVREFEEYKKISYFKRLDVMRKLIRKIKPNILVSFLPRMQIWMMFASCGMKIRRIETVRVNPWMAESNRGIERYLWKLCFERADTIIVQTKDQIEFFRKKIQQKCKVVMNPVAKQYIENSKISYADVAIRFVAVGRIAEQKNYPAMLEAFKLVSEKKSSICLEIYGTGNYSYVEKIQNIIIEKKLSERVKLKGQTTDILSVLLNADAFIMTSDFEGMPNALAEAMAVGLPCISTACKTGPRDLIDDCVNGLLVKVGDVPEIAGAISEVAEMSTEQRQNMGHKARKKILSLCDEENSLKTFINVINGCNTEL